MDHRADELADAIKASGANLLKYVSGGMSIEMEIPKSKWLKDNISAELIARAKFYDLPDFLTHRATGSEALSFCSVVCKQVYVPVGVDGSKEG
jgi:ribulose kinase